MKWKLNREGWPAISFMPKQNPLHSKIITRYAMPCLAWYEEHDLPNSGYRTHCFLVIKEWANGLRCVEYHYTDKRHNPFGVYIIEHIHYD